MSVQGKCTLFTEQCGNGTVTVGSFHVKSTQDKILTPTDLDETWFLHSVYRRFRPIPSVFSFLLATKYTVCTSQNALFMGYT